ncbi:MAG: stage V sporulation protein AD, partial [Firmicutes bacterium]|nr:stage V sporulation protein AD [Bacillota bacterium]
MGKRGEIDVKKQHGNQTVVFKSRPRVIGSFSIAGKKEGEGPLGSFINKIVSDDLDGEKTHEQAEQKLFESALAGAIKDAGIKDTDVDMLFAGDLLNQIISSSFTARGVDVSFIGVYGACSTMALSLALAASFVDAGHVTCAA